MATMTQIINELVAGWGKPPYDINNGECDDFMMAIYDRFGGILNHYGVGDMATTITESDLGYPDHIWTTYQGLHYDAECAGGVPCHLMLPIFTRPGNYH
ncbi:hypothetical protein LCGC14_2299430 [marine sediment metagenome]|uniref:Uncharacterized protein n=1 Tax=marine sediment metagenome TaxID=412755 RepID=A0A0F9CNV0_9ZZZZ